MYNHGAEGDNLLEVIEEIETYGATTFDNDKRQGLARLYPKVAEYNWAIMFRLLNYITSIAKGMVEHGVEHGLDAWRWVYHRHIPFVEGFLKFSMQELYALKQVSKNEIDSLPNEVERITGL